MRYRLRSSAVIIACLIHLSSCSLLSGDLWPRGRIEIEVGDRKARVEVVATQEDREKGLMHRTSLGENEGMLFVFPEEKILSFWMKNTVIPLDVAYFDSQGFLIDVQTMEPDGGRRIYKSSEPALYALEMKAGWFASNDLRRFARLKLPHTIKGQ